VAAVPIIALDQVVRWFDNGAVVAVQDVSLTVWPGDCMSISGPSGSGKSSLIHLMCGMDKPSAGVVTWKGRAINSSTEWTRLRASAIGVVFQDFLLLPALTALQNVQIAIAQKGTTAKQRDLALSVLDRVGLANRAKHHPHALSGGERQRVAIARSLVNNPELLLADEPTGNLDSGSSALVIQLLFDLQRQSGHALVLVTHDTTVAQRCAQQVKVSDGRILQEAR
jgi:predicted ABC-type transport system involved in lysophospholipase L1 biosynthesis ATPase subunit